MQLPPTPPPPQPGGIDDSLGGGGGEGSEGESVLPPPPLPLTIDGSVHAARSGGEGGAGLGRGTRGRVDRAPQLKPADTMEGLKQQVRRVMFDVCHVSRVTCHV